MLKMQDPVTTAMIGLEYDLEKNAGRAIDGPDEEITRDFANTNCQEDVEGRLKVTGSHVRRKIFIH